MFNMATVSLQRLKRRDAYLIAYVLFNLSSGRESGLKPYIHGARVCLRWCIDLHAMIRRSCSIVPFVNAASQKRVGATMKRRTAVKNRLDPLFMVFTGGW